MREESCDHIVRAVAQLPDRDVDELVLALDAGGKGLATFRARASSPVVRTACDAVLAATSATSASFAAGVLLGVLRARRTQRPSVDVVWSGPASSLTTSRLTSATVVDLVDAAASELLLAAYAMHDEPMLAGALERADGRGVSITLVAERTADNPNFRGPGTAFGHVRARRLHWPADRRGAGASLHAKVLVVDRAVALVGSANVTNSAMERNLECGILLRDRVAVSHIAQHVDELIRIGELTVVAGER